MRTELQERCYQHAQACYRVAAEKAGIYVEAIPIDFSNRMTKCAGKFTFRGNEAIRLRYSNVLLELNPEEFIARTVGHEVAHHIVHSKYGADVQPHGAEWKGVMLLLGIDDSRCHSMVTPKANKFEYVIDGKSHYLGKIQHGRCQRGTVYVSKKARITASKWVGV